MRVSKSNQCRLYQLCEQDVFTNQHKLGVAVTTPLTVACHSHVCMLHHTVDRDHQTWRNKTEREKVIALMCSSPTSQVLAFNGKLQVRPH